MRECQTDLKNPVGIIHRVSRERWEGNRRTMG